MFEYLDDDGNVRRELRPPEEVFDPKSMESFEQVPVTDDHPEVGLLDADTAKRYAVGATGEGVRQDGDHVLSPLMVFNRDTVKRMDRGKVQVSCGYTCDLDEKPGTHPLYGRYDAIQRNIRGNHVAIVDSARAGRTARVRMDGAATQLTHPPAGDRTMADKKQDEDKDKETIRSLNAQVAEHKARADEAESKLKIEQARADVAEGKLKVSEGKISELSSQVSARQAATETEAVSREKSRADAAEAKIARFDATMEKRIRIRSKLERQAAAVMGDDFRMDDLSDHQIRCEVVKRLDSSARLDGESDGVVEGRFLGLVDGFHKNARAQARVAEILDDNKNNTPRLDQREVNKKAAREMWKKPLPNDIRAPGAGKGQ